MTTSPSTPSSSVAGSDASGVPPGLPDPALLEKIANELFAEVPGGSSSLASASPVAGSSGAGLTGERQLRSAPAATGGSGPGPVALAVPDAVIADQINAPGPSLQSGVPPRPDRYGADLSLSSVIPSAISVGGPHSWPGRSSPPGAQLVSPPPATPGFEAGSLPVASLVPPLAGFGFPEEADVRRLLGFTRVDPESGGGVSKDAGGLPYCFLGTADAAPLRNSAELSLAPRSPDLEPLPDWGGLTSPFGQADVPASKATATEEPQGAPLAASGEAGQGAYYFLDESRAATASAPQLYLESRAVEPGLNLGSTTAHPAFDVNIVRRDFPILQETVNGKPLIWFDNAATTQKPQTVIDRLAYFYQHENSNIHRAAHELAARATDAYEAARNKVARFLKASSSDEIVFARGTTELINLVAQSWGRRYIEPGDEIVITWLEHHANIVPWQQLCAEKGARLKVAPVDDSGQVRLDEYEKLFTTRTKLASFTQVSNALGTVTPVAEMTEIAHRHGAKVLVDGAQSVSHMAVDVQSIGCDWFVFSGHKVFGPTGIGALWGKLDLLNTTPPWQGGGNMIQDVTFEKTIYQPAPNRFEAGTGNIADAVGLGAALDYVERIGMENIARYEHALLVYATERMRTISGLRMIGTAAENASVLSFVLDGFGAVEVGEALNREGIAVRAGHHCAQPILRRFGLEATVRPSLAFYNTCAEVDALIDAIRRIQSGSVSLPR
ncbi:MAG: SufS family cysteine desulfurase [Methylococcaceae bacterium]|nr:SufS family cysteine desulfurase [Methylococcaceae bacterium]